MVEEDTTYLWQTHHSVDVKILCTSVPASLFRTQSELGLACLNEVSTSKQASTARIQLTLRRPVVSSSKYESADLALNHNLSGSCIGIRFSCLHAGSAKTIFNNHADMGVSTLVSDFIIPRNTYFLQGSR